MAKPRRSHDATLDADDPVFGVVVVFVRVDGGREMGAVRDRRTPRGRAKATNLWQVRQASRLNDGLRFTFAHIGHVALLS